MGVPNSFAKKSRLKIRAGPAGLHIFDRTTGINILFDEVIPTIDTWSVAPRQVSIALTNACDLTCPYCYAPKHPATLQFDKLTTWLDELDANGCIGIGFGGGEPILYGKLVEICAYASRNTQLAVTMTTHGHHLSDKLLDLLSGNLHFVRVSMDGIGKTYESLRCRSFDTLIERIIALSKITSFGINYVVNSETIADLDMAVQLAIGLGASEFLLLPEEPVGRGNGIDFETTLALQKWVNEYHGPVLLSISEGNADGLPICDPLNAESGLAAFAHIDASAVIKRTSYDSKGIPVEESGIIVALNKLRTIDQEVSQ